MTRTTKDGLSGLIIRPPYVDWILDGKKTWEIRGHATKIRGRIALTAGGTGTIVGTCDLVDVRGPLKTAELVANARCQNMKPAELKGRRAYGDHTYAWVLSAPRRLKKPVPYKHPSGAVVWVKLGPAVIAKVGK